MTKRVGILSLMHESNTFAVTPTTIESFRRDSLLTGEEVRREFEGGLHQATIAQIDLALHCLLNTYTSPRDATL